MTFPTHFPASADRVAYGQDVYFLGFPYGINDAVALQENHLPMPLIKKACLSALIKDEEAGTTFLLDGHNNPGFSGGPVIFAALGQSFPLKFNVLGVVSGYRFDDEPAFLDDDPLPVTVRANTGIVICPSIEYALQEIRNNPNGVAITRKMPS